MVNFNIIEGANLDEIPFEDVLRDYTSSKLSVNEIMEKYDLSQPKWRRFRRYLQENNIPFRKCIRKQEYWRPVLLPNILLENIKKDYLNLDYTVKDIKAKYNLKEYEWSKIRDYLVGKGMPLRKINGFSFLNKNAKYYYKTRAKTYVVKRTFNRKMVYFGSYPSEELAQRRVAELEESNWEGRI